ncbi:hypothetical protein [Amycolatopsis sp. NPDC059657]|uniref:hypothetical protein n=1 Tax=Amycolatopsis sp. NPDC059657 TaxID=3346899 RepID=UPI00366B34FF
MTGAFERRLANRITSADRVWVSVHASGLSRNEIEAVAAKYGKKVVWRCADYTDQLLLIAEPGQLPLRTRSLFSPRTAMEVLPWLVTGMVGTGITVNIQLDYDVFATLVGLAGLALAAVAVVLPRLLPRPVRIELLAREFDGSPWVRIKPAHYPVSALMIGYVAATYGYRYMGFVPGNLGPTLVYATTTT